MFAARIKSTSECLSATEAFTLRRPGWYTRWGCDPACPRCGTPSFCSSIRRKTLACLLGRLLGVGDTPRFLFVYDGEVTTAHRERRGVALCLHSWTHTRAAAVRVLSVWLAGSDGGEAAAASHVVPAQGTAPRQRQAPPTTCCAPVSQRLDLTRGASSLSPCVANG